MLALSVTLLSGCGETAQAAVEEQTSTVITETEQEAEIVDDMENDALDSVELEDETDADLEPEEPIVEEVVIPWSEEKGIIFSNKIKFFSMPSFNCFTKNDAVLDGYSPEQSSLNYHITQITKLDTDTEGYVCYEVFVDHSSEFIMLNSTYESLHYAIGETYRVRSFCHSFEFIDYHSGFTFSCSIDDGKNLMDWNTVSWEDKDQLVSISCTHENESWTKWEMYPDRMLTKYSGTLHYTVVIPKEYDGLILYMRNGWEPDFDPYAEPDLDYLEAHLWDDDPSEYLFWRFNDIVDTINGKN